MCQVYIFTEFFRVKVMKKELKEKQLVSQNKIEIVWL
jgi:hypothetical protein